MISELLTKDIKDTENITLQKDVVENLLNNILKLFTCDTDSYFCYINRIVGI